MKLAESTIEKKLRRYDAIRDELKALEEERKKLVKELEEQTENHELLAVGAWELWWTRKEMPKTNYTQMLKDHPEIRKEDYTTITTTYAINVRRKPA